MVGFSGSRAVARAATAALALAVAFAAADGAAAKPKAKKPLRPAAPAVEAPISQVRPPVSERPRFFTINGVLARQQGRGATRLAAVDPATVTDAPVLPRLPETGAEPFGLFAFRAPEGQLWHKWRGLEARLARESAALAACRGDNEGCTRVAARFLAIVRAAAERSGRARLEYVNGALNAAIAYTTDFAQHGVADRWSAPLEALASGRGDCEDYAIAKYVALREAGVAAADLRIVLLRDTASREDHAVLAAREGGRWYVLDNRGARFAQDRELPHYMPLFGINQDGVSLFAAPYAWSLRGSIAEPVPATADAAPAEEPLALRGSLAATERPELVLPPVQPLL
ncbi:MAG: transglutaminase-like cysteine peptidase [Xanthobacteraceae bacterium]|nr:transglutaminase-like cysteine peptidase [Xanthobacteraceae bacterium]